MAVARARRLRVATHLAPSVQPLYAYLATYLGQRIGRRGELIVADSYERCARDIDDVCFVCSVPYLLLASGRRISMEVIAAPVLKGERYGGRPVYFSDVIVRAESAYQTFDDLRGTTFAYNEPFSHSGYLVVWHHLLSIGEGAEFFGRMVEAGFHHRAIRMVLDGSGDAAAIDSQVLAIELRDQPDLAGRLRIVGAIGPSTIQPVVATASRLTVGERHAIAAALIEINDDPSARPALDAAMVARFEALDGDAYDDIRAMLRRVTESNVLGDAWSARWEAATGLALPAA